VLLLVADPAMKWMFPGGGAPPPWQRQEGYGDLQVYTLPDLRWPTLALAVILFLVPSLLLGVVTPYAAKILIHRLGRLGSGVGKISGLSTAGAIAGTLGTTFYLIARLGTRGLIATNGLVLLGLGAAVMLAQAAARDPADGPGPAEPPAPKTPGPTASPDPGRRP
jgi:hypothetical protein